MAAEYSRAKQKGIKMPSGVVHVLEFNHSIDQREHVGDNAPGFPGFSNVLPLDIGAGTYMRAVEKTSPNWMRLVLDMCSCIITGRGKTSMYKSRMMPSTDCTIPQ